VRVKVRAQLAKLNQNGRPRPDYSSPAATGSTETRNRPDINLMEQVDKFVLFNRPLLDGA
jgi:hypothetical protein